MKINMQNWAQEIIDAPDRRVLPVLYFPCLTLTGDGIVDTVKDGKKMARNMKAVIDKFPKTIAAITGMDLTVDTEAFGAKVVFKDTEAPSIPDAPLKPGDIDALKAPDVHSGRVDIFLDAVKEAQNLITDRPVLGGQLGPFSLAANLVNIQTVLMMTINDKERLHKLVDTATEFLIARAKEYKKAGANGILLAEPTAGLLSPKVCAEYSDQYVKRIVDSVQDDYFFVILHDCGNVKKMGGQMHDTGAKGLHFGNAVKMTDILPQVPSDCLVFGNIDPTTEFCQGTPEHIRQSTLALLDAMKEYPHFVLSSGCDIPPKTPVENIEAFYSACEEYNSANA